MSAAIVEEESELEEAIHPRPGTSGDAVMAAGALVVVILASVAMERGASSLGTHFAVPEHHRRRSRPSRCDEPSQCGLGHLPRQAGAWRGRLQHRAQLELAQRHCRPLAPSDADRSGQAVWIRTARGRLVCRADGADLGSGLWGARAASRLRRYIITAVCLTSCCCSSSPVREHGGLDRFEPGSDQRSGNFYTREPSRGRNEGPT